MAIPLSCVLPTKKSKYQTQTHFIPALELAEEDSREKKDLDYVPNGDDEELE